MTKRMKKRLRDRVSEDKHEMNMAAIILGASAIGGAPEAVEDLMYDDLIAQEMGDLDLEDWPDEDDLF